MKNNLSLTTSNNGIVCNAVTDFSMVKWSHIVIAQFLGTGYVHINSLNNDSCSVFTVTYSTHLKL